MDSEERELVNEMIDSLDDNTTLARMTSKGDLITVKSTNEGDEITVRITSYV